MKRCVVAWTIWAGGVDHERSYVRERWRLVACGSPASTILGKRSPLPKAKVSSDTDRCQYPYLRACELVRSAQSRRRLIGRKRLDGRKTTNSRGRRQSLAVLAQRRLQQGGLPPARARRRKRLRVPASAKRSTDCGAYHVGAQPRRHLPRAPNSPPRSEASRQWSTAVGAPDRIEP